MAAHVRIEVEHSHEDRDSGVILNLITKLQQATQILMVLLCHKSVVVAAENIPVLQFITTHINPHLNCGLDGELHLIGTLSACQPYWEH